MSEGQVITYNKSQSCIVCYGIDKNFDTSMIKKDVETITHAFDDYVKEKKSYIASQDDAMCTSNGILKSLQENLSKVGEGGIFIFYFTGHGCGIADTANTVNEWAMVPSDYNGSQATLLTAEALTEKIELKRDTKLLFILDCCYSGGMVHTLTDIPCIGKRSNIFVLSSCTAQQKSHVSDALGCSVYTYFLSVAISKFRKPELATQDTAKFFVETIHNCSKKCTKALASLIKDEQYSMSPQLGKKDFKSVLVRPKEDLSDFIDRFPLVNDLFKGRGPITKFPYLQDETMEFIKDICKPALQKLQEEHMLSEQKVVSAVLSSMMYSVGICDTQKNRFDQLQVFTAGLNQVIKVLDEFRIANEVLNQGLYWAWKRYMQALWKECGQEANITFATYEKIWQH